MHTDVVTDIITDLQNSCALTETRLIAQRTVQASVPSRIEIATLSYEVIGDGVFNFAPVGYLEGFDTPPSSPQERATCLIVLMLVLLLVLICARGECSGLMAVL